jgi:hypothetical protein
MPIGVCRTCQSEFRIVSKPGRRPHYCSQECRSGGQGRSPLAESTDCPTCGKTFKPGRPAGIVQRYCSRLCNPGYGWACTACGVIKDAGNRRDRTASEKYVCRPCRRAASEALAAVGISIRVAVPGTLRPIDPQSGFMLQGPSLLQNLTAVRHPNGSASVQCPGCRGWLAMSADHGQMVCGPCLVLIGLEG